MTTQDKIRNIATKVGMDLDEEAMLDYAAASEELAEQSGAFESQTPEPTAATDVESGDDDHNAVRYRFTLSGDADGPLAGLSVGVKDNLAVAGVPMHCGSAALSFTPDYHATVVDRLLGVGGAVEATTNMDEFAYFTTGETCAFGTIENPVTDGVPGGSSSGSAAAVAAGTLDAALGSDTGGSVRIPAAHCGVVGLKPTHRAVPRFGLADLAPSLDCIGPLADDVETVARLYDAIAGPSPRDPSSLGSGARADATDGLGDSASDMRVGVVEPAMDDATDIVAAAVADAVETLADAGVETTHISLPGYRTATMAGLTVAGLEFARLALDQGQVLATGTGHSEPWRAAVVDAFASPDLGENIREQILANAAVLSESSSHYVAALNHATEFTATVGAALESADALVTPTTPTTAPAFGEVVSDADFARTVANTAPFNLTGHPGLSVPGGTVDGAPVGVQFVGHPHDERTLVTLGETLTDHLS